MPKPVRRIVTGHNVQGKSIILSDENAANVFAPKSLVGLALTDLWETKHVPASNKGERDAAARPFKLEPPKQGTVFRVVDFPPDTVLSTAENISKIFEEIGSPHTKDRNNPRHPGFHKTNSVDYAIVLEGEIWAMMDEGETLMKAGDVLIQRGTNHAWSNRTNAPARVAFILVAAEGL
jgi:hypothetical protein